MCKSPVQPKGLAMAVCRVLKTEPFYPIRELPCPVYWRERIRIQGLRFPPHHTPIYVPGTSGTQPISDTFIDAHSVFVGW